MEISEEYIESITYPEYVERGREYFLHNKIVEMTTVDGVVRAVVLGSKRYTVTVDMTDLETDCDCPIASQKHPCKHVVAVLFCLMSGIKKIVNKNIEKVKKEKKEVKIVKNILINDVDDFEKLTSDFKSLVRSQHKYFPKWNRYFNVQNEILDEGADMIHKVGLSFESFCWGLQMAKWYDKELLKIDDSNGTNQMLEEELYLLIIQAANDLKLEVVIKELEKIFREETNYDYQSDIINLYFEEGENKEIIEYLGALTDNEKYKCFKYCKAGWCNYLLKNNDARFEQKAISLAKDSYDILLLLLKFYEKSGDTEAIWKYGFTKTKSQFIGPWLEQYLTKIGDKEKLKLLLILKLDESVNKEDLRKIKKIFDEENDNKSWEELISKLLNKKMVSYERLELLFYLKMYDEIVDELIRTSNNFDSRIENYAMKLSVLDKNSAKKLYWFLIGNEEKKMVHSSSYKDFFIYLDMLLKLDDRKKVADFARNMALKYPTRIKFGEGVARMCKNL